MSKLVAVAWFASLIAALQLVPAATGAVRVPVPTEIAIRLAEMSLDGSLFVAIGQSLRRVLAGFGLAVAIGTPIGLAIGMSDAWRSASAVPVNFFRFIAPITWIPVAVLLFGDGQNAAIAIVAYATMFPVVFQAANAVKAIDRRHAAAAAVLGAGRALRVVAVVVPSALPLILSGVRIALGFAWASIVAAELAMGIKIESTGTAQLGIGQIMIRSLYVERDINALVGLMIVIGALSFAIDRGLRFAGAKLTPWTPHAQ